MAGRDRSFSNVSPDGDRRICNTPRPNHAASGLIRAGITCALSNTCCRHVADDGIVWGVGMAGQERVAVLEGRVAELSQVFEGIQAQLRGFEERVDRRFEGVDRRFDNQFEGVDRRFEGIDRRFDDLNHRLETLDAKISRFFMWAVGVQVMMWTAVVGAILAR
jgi:hypothetical protein